MNEISDQVEHHEVDRESDPGPIGHAGPRLIEMERAPAGGANRAQQFVEQRIEREEHREPKHAEPVH